MKDIAKISKRDVTIMLLEIATILFVKSRFYI